MRWEDFTFQGSPLRRRIGFNEATRQIVMETHQPNIEECLRLNRAWFNAERRSSSLWAGRDWVKVASVPLWVIEKWMQEGVNYFDPNCRPEILRRLNDTEYERLRTERGRL